MNPSRFFQSGTALMVMGALTAYFSGTADSYGQTPGVECNCDTTGKYVAPASKTIQYEEGGSVNEVTSPGGTYTLEATDAIPPNVSHIIIRQGSTIILSVSSRATGWGFSPDGHRFVMHGFTSGGQHTIWLYNLNPDPTRTGEPALEVESSPPTTLSSASLRFSPHGKYLLYAGLGYSHTLMLIIYDTENGNKVYETSGGAPIEGQPSGNSVAGWGFSPDVADRTFVHAVQTDIEVYTLIVRNLETGKDVVRSVNNTGDDVNFRFSLCGDYFLWSSREEAGDRHCYFFKTSEENPVPEHYSGEELEYVKTDANNHRIKFIGDGTVYTFENTAGGSCPDEDPPSWPPGAELTVDSTTGTTAGLSWDAASEPAGKILYSIYHGSSLLIELFDSLHCMLEGLTPSTSYSLKLWAEDASGNRSSSLSATAVTQQDLEPEWDVSASLDTINVKSTKMTLSWSGASDDWGITSFRLFRNGKRDGEVDGETTEYTFTGLTPEDTDTFKVEAGDAFGQWTDDGPQLIQATATDLVPYWDPMDAIHTDEITETSIAFHWDPASDDYGVIKYRISNGVSDPQEISGYTTEYLDEGLEAGTHYTYEIEAGDEAGNWSVPLTEEISTLPTHVELPLATAAGAQWMPDIDERLVVWQDNRGGDPDIYSYNLRTDEEDDLITDAGTTQRQARSSEGRVVWSDNRDGDFDIFMYDMYNPMGGIVTICDAPGDQVTPSIEGNLIVWTDYRSDNWDIYMYDLATGQETPVCTNSSSQINPDVSGIIIVWEDRRHGNPDIYGYNVYTGKEFTVCKHDDEQRKPVVQTEPEFRIFWQDNRGSYWEIYMRVWFIDSYTNLKVYLGYSGNKTHPDIADDVLVYQNDKDGDEDIYSYAYYNRWYGNVEEVCLETGDQLYPRTSKGRIVWEDHRNDEGDIYIWDRPPGTDLSLEILESSDPIGIGKTLVYEIRVGNLGPDDEDSARVVCSLPIQAQLKDTTVSKGTLSHDGYNLVWTIGPLPNDSSASMRIQMRTYELADLRIQAEISGKGFDPEPSNNRAVEMTEVKLVAGETIGKGTGPAMFVMPGGTVHMSYGTEDSVAYATKVMQGGWQKEFLDSVTRYLNGDIVRDAAGNIHICYSDEDWERYPKSFLYHLNNAETGEWENNIVAINDTGFSSISLLEDGYGIKHMMYQKAPGAAFDGEFEYTNNRDGVWARPVTFYGEGGYDHIDMVLDEEDHGHAVYIAINRGVIYRKSQDTIIDQWLPEELIEEDWRGGQLEGMVVDIGLDSSGIPHIIYPGGTDGDHEENIKYARRTNGNWHIEEVDDGDFPSAGNAIAVEPSGIAHVCYTHVPTHQLRYATNVAGPWIKQIIERGVEVWGSSLDMALDVNKNVHIAYTKGEYVKYALRPPIGYFTIEPDTLDFGTVPVNDSLELGLKLTNEWAGRIFIDSVYALNDEGYEVDFAPFVLYRGQTDSIRVRFAPTKSMKNNTSLRICFTSNSRLFMDIPMKGTTPIPELTVDPDAISFGIVIPYNQATRTATISNTGSADLVFSDIKVEYRLFGNLYPTDFDLLSENCGTLAPGESCEAVIEFYPTKTGTQNSYLVINSNDPETPEMKVSISGYGRYPAAQILVDKNSVDFGYVEVSGTAADTLNITNSGDTDLAVSSVSLSGTNADHFSFDNQCTSIVPGDTCTITLEYSPPVAGESTASLRIYSNSQYSNPYTVSLSGSSSLKKLGASDTLVDFGNVAAGDDKMALVTFTNEGDHDVWISNLSIYGADAYEFLHTGFSGTLTPGESVNDTLWFAPIFPGDKRAVLRVESNDTEYPQMDILLKGTSFEGIPELEVSVGADPRSGLKPLSVQFQSSVTGGSQPYTFLWAFGDGESSSDPGPLHVYEEAGSYMAKLNVTDSEGAASADSVSIAVGEPGELVIALEATPSSGTAPLTVQFNVLVSGGVEPYTYEWSIEEFTGNIQDPVYVFEQPGTYWARVRVDDTEGRTESDSISVMVTGAGYSLSGKVFLSDGITGVTDGTVELMQAGTVDPLEVFTLSASGDFFFTGLTEGEYTLKALPGEGSPNSLPTYLGDVLVLYEATILEVNGNLTGQDIRLQDVPEPGTGNGNISGTLQEAEGKKNGIILLSDLQAEGTALADVSVYLAGHADGSLAGADLSDAEGRFEFGGLEQKSYELKVDYSGIPMDESNPLLNINEVTDSISLVAVVYVNRISTEIIITGIGPEGLPEGLKVFPNPASEALYIQADPRLIKQGIKRIFLLGITGNVEVSEYFYHSGEELTEIPLGQIPEGIYILRLETGQGFYNVQVVVLK